MILPYSTRRKIDSILQKERGTIHKVFGSLPSVAVCFPNSYYLGTSNLGVHFLYEQINKRDDWLAERFFADIVPLVSLESQQPLNRFDIIAFSVAFELDFANLLEMLKSAHIPLRREERSPSDPLIVAGGVAISMNPLPLYDFVDLLIIGDGEETLDVLLDAYLEAGRDKGYCIRGLKGRDGFFIPEAGAELRPTIPRRALCANLNNYPLASAFVSPETEFANTCLIEIARGCPFNCAFCYIGHNQNPFRVRSFVTIREIIKENRVLTNRFGLVSSAVTSHPEIEEICRWGLREGLIFSFSSLRADNLPPVLLEVLRAGRQRTLTLAPETGSDAFRRTINKNLTNEQILEAVRNAFAAGFTNVKLYFILGLPGEGKREITESVELVKAAQGILLEEGKKKGRTGEIMAAISFFVPKPGTPFAEEVMPDASDLRRRQQAFVAALRPIPHIRVQTANPYEAIAQMRLSTGGRDEAELLLNKVNKRLSWKAALKTSKY